MPENREGRIHIELLVCANANERGLVYFKRFYNPKQKSYRTIEDEGNKIAIEIEAILVKHGLIADWIK